MLWQSSPLGGSRFVVSMCCHPEWFPCAPQQEKDKRPSLIVVCWTVPRLDRCSSYYRVFLSSPTIAATWIRISLHRDCCWNRLDGYLKDNTVSFCCRFSLQFVSAGLLALVPTIHALAEPLHDPSPLATAFGRLLLINFFGWIFYVCSPLERIGMARIGQPGVYTACT